MPNLGVFQSLVQLENPLGAAYSPSFLEFPLPTPSAPWSPAGGGRPWSDGWFCAKGLLPEQPKRASRAGLDRLGARPGSTSQVRAFGLGGIVGSLAEPRLKYSMSK